MTAEEKRERKNLNQRNYYQRNKEKILTRQANYQKEHTELHNSISRNYYNSKPGRAVNLLNSYKRRDIDANRGECTITQKWILENIFTSPCIYCGETDWTKLGCDRIDNTLPHTPENCVCACVSCNAQRGNRWTVEEFKTYKQKGSGPIATPHIALKDSYSINPC